MLDKLRMIFLIEIDLQLIMKLFAGLINDDPMKDSERLLVHNCNLRESCLIEIALL